MPSPYIGSGRAGENEDRMQLSERLLKVVKNVVVDIEVLSDTASLERVSPFLETLRKSSERKFLVLVPKDTKIEQDWLKVSNVMQSGKKHIFERPKNLYETYSLIHTLFGNPRADWLECRRTLYLNYFKSNSPIHSPKELNVYSTPIEAKTSDRGTPIICPLKKLRTCNIARNCIHNCIFCYVPHSGAPKTPLVVCTNMPEKIEDQIKQQIREQFVATDFGSLTDPCNSLIDGVFRVFRDTFQILKKYDFPCLVLTKAAPPRELLQKLTFQNALLAFSFYHTREEAKRRWELNTPGVDKVFESMNEAKALGVRTALRVDVLPGYNDNLKTLSKIVYLAKKNADIEHVVAGSFRGRPGILKQIQAQNPRAYESIMTSLDKNVYSDRAFRPKKEFRVKWYRYLRGICEKEGISFSLCKEELDFVLELTSHWTKDGSPRCLCQFVQSPT